MPGPIQKRPDGLLQFVQVFGGDNPPLLGDTVVPTIDVSEFYGSRRIELASDTTSGAMSGGTNIALQVPANEQWRLHNLTAKIDTFSAAGDTVLINTFIRFGGLGSSVTPNAPVPQYVVADTDDAFRVGYQFSNPLVLAPGSRFGAVNDMPLAATATLSILAAFERLDA